MSIPRPEYPRPQFVRDNWLCLNGPWQFEIDHSDTGLERGLVQRELKERILVPFCPESSLSGIGYLDFMEAVWYRRTVRIPPEWAGHKVLLHFQAVDYEATVWVNGQKVGQHRGGFTPFTCDLEGVVSPGEEATIVVRAQDPRGEPKPQGKQTDETYYNVGARYVRTTGIWQTVWMEPVPLVHLRRPRITPDVAGCRFRIEQPITNSRPGTFLQVIASDEQGVVSQAKVSADSDFTPVVDLVIPKERCRLWAPGDPHLYDLEIVLTDANGQVLDRARSYAGLRSVTIEGKAVKINGKTLFQRLVLDQGFYPDGILTAPSDEALRRDIELALAAGFNGARLHQKVFEERFLYHADRMGYLVWGEFGDWGFRKRDGVRDPHRHQAFTALIAQWLEVLERDYSHPCIIGWCPLNETSQKIEDGLTALDDVTRALFLATKAMDLTRPVLDASGYSHRVREADIYDSHNYTQDPQELARLMAGLAEGKPYTNPPEGTPTAPWSLPYSGQPYFVSEFGGTWWQPKPAEEDRERKQSWGYGRRPETIEEFYQRFEGLCAALLNNPHMFGYCYTQLTDVFQEQNGIYFFDRRPKFDLERIRRAQTRRAAIEE